MLFDGRAGAVNKAILYNGHIVAFFRGNRSECTWYSNNIFLSVIYKIRFNNNFWCVRSATQQIIEKIRHIHSFFNLV